MSEHRFHLSGSWTGDLSGEGLVTSGGLDSPISVPKEMNGPGKGTNPEELLLGASASCYLITLAVMLGKAQIPYRKLEISSEGSVVFEAGLHFTKIVHRPRLTLEPNANQAQVAEAHKAAKQAEEACMISRALRGNVTVSVDAEVVSA